MAVKKLKLPVIDLTGKKTGEIDLPAAFFSAKVNPELMAQAVKVYLSNQRKAFAQTKTRAEVRGSGRKIWRQKGTGRARHGDRYAPIFVGGGRAHGPVGNQAYRLKLPKKMRQAALASSLTVKMEEKNIIVVEGMKKASPKTKENEKMFTKIIDKFDRSKKYLLVLPDKFGHELRGIKNLPFLTKSVFSDINTYLVLNSDCLIFTKESLDSLNKK